jgi:hypothetical protein
MRAKKVLQTLLPTLNVCALIHAVSTSVIDCNDRYLNQTRPGRANDRQRITVIPNIIHEGQRASLQ